MSQSETSIDSLFTNALACRACNTEWVTDFISTSNSDVVIRCGNCGEIWSPLQRAGAVDKNAWRSLWLGLASVVLVCFTGIPAMYLGIKSLLRTRYAKTRIQDRRAAIAGTILGGVFGILGSFCVFGLGGAILVVMFSNVNATNKEQAMYVLNGLVDIDLPPEFEHARAAKMLGSSTFRFGDHADRETAEMRFDLIYFPPAMIGSITTLNSQLKSRRLDSRATYQQISNEPLRWSLCDSTADINKLTFKETREDESTHTVSLYHGFSVVEKGIFAVCFVFRDTSAMNEERVQSLVESIVPNDEIDIDRRWKEVAKIVPAADPASDEPADSDSESEATPDEDAGEDAGEATDSTSSPGTPEESPRT